MKIIWYFFLIILALTLTILLIQTTSINTEDFYPIFLNFNYLAFTSVILLTTLHIWLSAEKWRIVTANSINRTKYAKSFFFKYTALGALLSEFVPAYLSSTAVRSVALRFHHDIPVLRGSATSIFDQIFDVYVFFLCSISSVIFLFFETSLIQYLYLNTAFLLVGVSVIYLAQKLLPSQTQDSNKIFWQFISWLQANKNTLIKLYYLSVIRFFIIIIRNMLIVSFLQINIPYQDILIASPLVQLSILVALTPGSIGVLEWSWTGLLNFMSVNLADAALYAMTNRIISLLAIITMAVIYFSAMYLKKPQS